MIEINNLNYSYRGSRKVFENLDIEIPQGGICGLLGKNGVGKTTLFNIVSGLIFAPKGSDVSVMEFKPRKREVSFLERIFLLPEEFELPRISVYEFAANYGKFYPRYSAELLYKLLNDFEVSPSDKFHTMSFGQRKKAYIAFALACNTELLLLDEPTNGLDIPSKTAFRRALASVADDQRTIIISTHQVRDLEEILDRVVILERNQVLLNASTLEITQKLRFEVVASPESAIYCQPTIHGLLGVTVNNNQDCETKLDMELLFNAVNASPDVISRIFNA